MTEKNIARIKLTLEFDYPTECKKDDAQWYYEENFCVLNFIDYLKEIEEPNTCHLCNDKTVEVLYVYTKKLK